MPKATDANQKEIVAALRQLPGVTVADTHELGRGFPDILVGCSRSRWGTSNYLIEIKTADGKLNAREALWHDTWRGQVAVAHTIDEALAIIGYYGGGYNTDNDAMRPPSARAGEW